MVLDVVKCLFPNLSEHEIVQFQNMLQFAIDSKLIKKKKRSLFYGFRQFNKYCKIIQTLSIKVVGNLIQNQIIHYNRSNLIGMSVQFFGTTTEQIIATYCLSHLGVSMKIIGIILIFI